MGILSGLLTRFGSPTSDLYLGWSCAEFLLSGAIRRITPTVFLAGRTLIVVRHDADLRGTPDFDQLIYVIDDDWRMGLSDPELPLDYRAKLRLVEARIAPRLESAAKLIVVSSEALLNRYQELYPGKRVEILAPTWAVPKSEIAPRGNSRETNIAILGARTHRSDLAFLAPVLTGLAAARSDLQFTISAEAGLPNALRHHRQVTTVPSMNWPSYLQWMRGKAFDIGLYRLAETGFNAARSINKLQEYDMFGAAVIGSMSWLEGQVAGAEGQCVLVPDDPDAWRDAILQLADNPEERIKIAWKNRDKIEEASRITKQRQFWKEQLFE